MTVEPDILVTGATGTVGRELVSQLLGAGHAVRALVRDPVTAGLPDGVELVHGDLADAGSVAAAAEGVGSVLLIWPFATTAAASDIAPDVVRAAAAQGRRVVYLSAEAAEHQPDSFWAQLERLVAGSAEHWTLLRPTGFAKNTLMWAGQISTEGVVRWPFAAATRSLIHEADIAAVAVHALTGDGQDGKTYVLTGPQALTQVAQVDAIGRALGRSLRFEEISREHTRPGLVAAFGDEAFADTALDTWAAFVNHPERVTTTVQDVTGRPARSLYQWATDHAASFR